MKMSSRFFCILCTAICSSLLGSKFGTWQDIFLEKFYNPWLIQYNQESRFDNRGKHFCFEYNDIGFWYTGITKWFHVGAFYRYYMIEPAINQVWIGEHAPHLDARIRTLHNNVFFQDRMRFQYISGPITKQNWIFRNEVLLSFNTHVMEIFGSAEPYCDITTKKLIENDLTAGVGKQVGKHFNGKVYYRNVQYPHSRAGRVMHFLGFLITLSF